MVEERIREVPKRGLIDKILYNTILFFIGVMIMGSLITLGQYFYDIKTIPASYKLVKNTQVVPQGGKFTADFEVTRYKGCTISFQRSISSLDRDYEYRDVTSTKYVDRQVEPVEVTVAINIPLDIPVGSYYYVSQLDYSCSWANRILGSSYTTQTPPAFFKIISKEGNNS